MKTAISIPDDLFREAEEFAERQNLSRSALYARAVEAYLSRRRSEDVTAKLNEVYATESSELDPALALMQFGSLSHEDW